MEEKTDVLAQAESTDEADVQKEVAGKTAKAGLLHVEMRSFVWLCLLILAACLLGLSKYLFEGRLFVFANDIGSDTWQQYLSLYAAIARKIAAGDFSLWSTTIGFGTSIFMLNPGNPALVVAYLLGAACGVEILPSVMIFLYIAEIFAAGILAYLYLSTFSFGEVPKLLAAFMYAFSGFMIVWGQHYQFAIVPALTMLELLMAERCLKGRRYVGLVLATAISVISSMYIAYMLLLFTGVYLLLRLFLRERKLRIYIKEAFRVLWPILLGVGLAMVTLLPSAANIFLVSSRMERYASLAERLFDPLPGAYYLALLERLFSCAAQGVDPEGPYLNYYEGPCIFFTTLFIPLIWQYICLLRGRKITKRRMRLAIVLLLVGLLAMLTPTAGTIFNGFTGTFNRYMFLFMPGFALLSAVTLQEIFHEHRFSLLGAFLASLMLVLGYGWIILEDLDTRMDFVMIAHVVGGTAMLIFLHLASGGESVFDDVG
ncbi:MAG: YfhO family protein, partial [Lachnospiraceae bacterium]